MATSSAAVGVALKAPVMPMHAVLCNLMSSFTHTFFYSRPSHQGSIRNNWSYHSDVHPICHHWLQTHDLPNVALQAQKTLRALVTICYTCCFQVSPLSNISPRYQKIAPLILISYIIIFNLFFIFIIISSVLIGTIGGYNQTSIRTTKA